MSAGITHSVDPDPSEETQRPRLRRELEYTHRHLGDAVEVIVYNPLTGSYFRAGELETALFALLYFETPLDEITTHLTRTFPDLPAEDVPAFIQHLGRLGFLEGSKATRARPPIYQRLLYAQVRVANPERLFARLVPYVVWLYRPAGWAAVAALFLIAGGVAFGSRDDLRREMEAAFTPGFWLWLWLGVILLGTIHEFGHGLTCKYFGARSTGIGLLFIYGMPCFYCDVSGAWMLPRKSQRLWVGAAGLYYQFIAGALALLLWRVVEPGTLISVILLVMVASCGLLSLLNLNPLLKLDGYYLLSDALEIPNLRQRAFDELWRRLGRCWLGTGREESDTAVTEATQRNERVGRICLAYGVLAALFLAWLIPLLVRGMGRFLIGRFGGTGALLLVLFIALQFGTPASQAVIALGRRLARWKEIPMSGRRRLHWMGGALAVLLPVSAVLPWQVNLTVPCKVEAEARAAVRARADGRLAELTTREGARVRSGQVVGHLAIFEREQRRTEREARLRMIQMDIAALQDRLPIVAAEARKIAAEAATAAQEARTRLAEEREILPSRVAEARRQAEAVHADLEAAHARLAEAQAAVKAQSHIALRRRGDADCAVRGDAPPAIAAAREIWQQRVLERDQAHREYARQQLLVADGAVAPQQLEHAQTRSEAAGRAAEQTLQELAEAKKQMREAAQDAEAELARRQAARRAARAAEAAAQACEARAREALRQVEAASSPARLETARLRAASGEAVLTAARAGHRELLARRSEIHARRQQAAQLAAQIAILTDQLQRSALIAPCDGVVTTPRVEERIGAQFHEGATVLQVENPRKLRIRIFVTEKEIGAVRVGQTVALRAAAFPQRLYAGQVSEIAPRAVKGGSAAFPTNIVEVRLQVEDPTGELRPGMSGWAKIDCGRHPPGAILFRRVTRYLRGEVWSWF